MQTVAKKILAAGMLYQDLKRLETKMRHIHNTENEMLKPKVLNEHSTWHEICHTAVKVVFKQGIICNHKKEWVSRRLARNLKERGHCLMLCRLEDNLSLGFEKEQQLSEEIEELIRSKERPAKFATLVEGCNQFLYKMDKIDDQKSKHL